MKNIFAIIVLLCAQVSICAEAYVTGAFPYKIGTDEAEGFLAIPKNIKNKVPAVLIIHDWMGPSEFTDKKAQDIADLGYVALAADIYGKGVRPKDGKEAGALAGKYKGNRTLLRQRVTAAYDALRAVKGVDTNKIVVIGYCFGGTTALELGRSGAALVGLVTFHGGLDNPTPADAKNIKAKSLIMHGALDPHVPPAEVAAFQKEMNDAGVDYQFIAYSGAVHSFTNPKANDFKAGAAYNAVADHRSWDEFKNFMKEVTQ